MSQPVTPPPAPGYQPAEYPPPAHLPPARQTKTNTLAIVGFVAAFVIPIAGLVLGVIARNQLRSPENPESGSGLALWAMIIGAIGTLFQVGFVIVWLSLFVNIVSRVPVGG